MYYNSPHLAMATAQFQSTELAAFNPLLATVNLAYSKRHSKIP